VIWQIVIPCISGVAGSVLGCWTVIAIDSRRSPFRQLSARRERRIKRSIREAVVRAAREIEEAR
jgi:hypothetical protein